MPANSWAGTRNSAATWLQKRSILMSGGSSLSKRVRPDSPEKMWATSWARVKSWAAMKSAELTKTRGGEFVDEGETLELGAVEFAGCVVADDAVEDDEDADLVELIAEMAEGEVPGGNLCGPAGLEVERGVHGCGDFGVAVARVVGTDEGGGGSSSYSISFNRASRLGGVAFCRWCRAGWGSDG